MTHNISNLAIFGMLMIIISQPAIAGRTASINCGAFGPVNSEISCPAGQSAACRCKASGVWGNAFCECVPEAPPAPVPAVTAKPELENPNQRCHIDAHSNLACAGAGLISVFDPGCKADCLGGYEAECRDATCVANTWTQSLCMCVAK